MGKIGKVAAEAALAGSSLERTRAQAGPAVAAGQDVRRNEHTNNLPDHLVSRTMKMVEPYPGWVLGIIQALPRHLDHLPAAAEQALLASKARFEASARCMSSEQWSSVLREYCNALLGVVQPYAQESADALEAVISGRAPPTKETALRQAYSMRCQALVFEVLQDRPIYIVPALRYAASTYLSTDEFFNLAGDTRTLACAHSELLILFFESVVRCVEVSEEP
jgi:hypothetical protein